MKLLYVNEHLLCKNYEKGKNPIFEIVTFTPDEIVKKSVQEAEIIFVKKGNFNLLVNLKEQSVKQKEIILLPPASQIRLTPIDEGEIVVLRIKSTIHLCEIQPLNKLFDKNDEKIIQKTSLIINDKIDTFLTLLTQCMKDGLRCKCFMELKAKEIFYYFRGYYEKEKLREFFSPLLTEDYNFTIFIYENFKKVKSVKQFADLYGSSLSSFEKQFKNIFNITAYQWMTEQKSKLIYNDLIHSDKSLIEIADDYYFSSLSQFCDFCKRIFGTSPGRLRKTKICPNEFLSY